MPVKRRWLCRRIGQPALSRRQIGHSRVCVWTRLGGFTNSSVRRCNPDARHWRISLSILLSLKTSVSAAGDSPAFRFEGFSPCCRSYRSSHVGSNRRCLLRTNCWGRSFQSSSFHTDHNILDPDPRMIGRPGSSSKSGTGSVQTSESRTAASRWRGTPRSCCK